MTDKYEIIPTSNPIEKDRKRPIGFIAFNSRKEKQSDPASEAVNVLSMEEIGVDRSVRRKEILSYFPDNSPEGARVVETIVNKTTGFSLGQLNTLLSHVRLKDFRDSEKFINTLEESIQKTWMEDL